MYLHMRSTGTVLMTRDSDFIDCGWSLLISFSLKPVGSNMYHRLRITTVLHLVARCDHYQGIGVPHAEPGKPEVI